MESRLGQIGAPVPGEPGTVSLLPLGIGHPEAPSPVQRVADTVWRGRGELAASLDLLVNGVCEGCCLGPRGLADDAAPGMHICALRLEGMASHTAEPVVPADLIDSARLRARPTNERESLGRLVQPFRWRRNDRGFQAVSWAQALKALSPRLREAPAEACAALLRPAGGCLETFAAAAELWMGTERVFLARDEGVGAAQQALATRLGDEAASCSLADLAEADLILLVGIDPGLSHPDLLRLIERARRRGARVLALAPDRLPDSERAWTLGSVKSALFGSRLIDDLVLLRPRTDGELLQAVLRRLEEKGDLGERGAELRADGLPQLRGALMALDPTGLREACGVDEARVDWVAELLRRARTVVSVVGAGLCWEPASAARAMAALAHLHLGLGLLGRPGCGILPLYEDEGERGARELGLGGDAQSLARALRERPHRLLLTVGDHPLGALRQPGPLLQAMTGLPLAIHLTGRVQELHLQPLAEETWLLPLQSRYTQEGGALVATVERRLRYSPEIGGLPVGEALPGWSVLAELDRLARGIPRGTGEPPTIQDHRRRLPLLQPAWRGVEGLDAKGDHLQRGGRLLFTAGFPAMPGGRARFHVEP